MYNVVGRMLAKLKAQYLTGRHEAMLVWKVYSEGMYYSLVVLLALWRGR